MTEFRAEATKYELRATKILAYKNMKYLVRISIASITFTVGLLSSFFYSFLLMDLPQVKVAEETTMANHSAKLSVTVCQLDSFPDKYDGEQVVTEATIFTNGDGENLLSP